MIEDMSTNYNANAKLETSVFLNELDRGTLSAEGGEDRATLDGEATVKRGKRTSI